MMKSKLFIVIALVAALFSTSVLHAKSGGDPEKMITKITEKLQLDTTQQAHFRGFIESKKALRESMKETREANKENKFSELNAQDTITVDDIYATMDAKKAEKRELQRPVMEKFVIFRNSLSVAQREQAEDIMHKLISKRGHKHGGSNKQKGDK